MDALSFGYDSEDERLEIRKKYIELDQKLDDSCDLDTIEYALEQADKLLPKIRNPSEAQLDSALLQKCGVKTLEEIRKAEAGTRPTCKTLACRLLEFCTTDIGEGTVSRGLTPQNWDFLRGSLAPLMKSLPTLDFLYGTFDTEQVLVREKRKRRLVEKDAPGELVRVAESEGSSKRGLGDEDTPQEVDHIYQTFLKVYRDNRERPIPFFKFVCDPTSFSATVENIFYFTFLLKDRMCRMLTGEEGAILVELVKPEEAGRLPKESEGTSALELSMDLWQRFIKAYDIRKAMIPPRRT